VKPRNEEYQNIINKNSDAKIFLKLNNLFLKRKKIKFLSGILILFEY
jgi:hypothetical protein